jgi:hypothetical protein
MAGGLSGWTMDGRTDRQRALSFGIPSLIGDRGQHCVYFCLFVSFTRTALILVALVS